MIFFISVNLVGFCLGATLYVYDIKYCNGILNKVHSGDTTAELMNSPDLTRKDLIDGSMSKDP